MNLKIKIPNQLTFDLKTLYVFEKKQVTFVCYLLCLFLLFYGSMHPWFMWPFMDYYKVLAGGIGFFGLMIDNSSSDRILTQRNTLKSIVVYAIYLLWTDFVNDLSVSALPLEFFSVLAVLTVLRANDEIQQKAMDITSKMTAGFLVLSIFFFILYLLHFPLPSINAAYGDGQYLYSNYFFFMIDDRYTSSIIPRFHSILLEPGHLAGCTCFLLLTQFGKWKRWYNIVLIITTLMTFSLAGYAFLLVLIFLNMWVHRKQIITVLIVLSTLVGAIFVGAINYNGGDNMINNLIFLRLEIDDKTGDVRGNNRVSEDFKNEFIDLLQSPDVLVGREFQQANDKQGNSGYRVFIYENGIISALLIFLFYYYCMRGYKDIRFLLSAIILLLMMFWSRGYPQQYSYLFCIIFAAHQKYQTFTPQPSLES